MAERYIFVKDAHYVSELAEKKSFKKIGCYTDYCDLVFREEKMTFAKYAQRWDMSKDTAYKYVNEFKKINRISINNELKNNEIQGKKEAKSANALPNNKTNAKQSATTGSKDGSANDKTNALPNDAFLYINNIKYIVGQINAQLGTSFKSNAKKTNTLLSAILKDGYAVNDIVAVVTMKINEWGNDSKMKQYLTPNTLFAYSNFEKYFNQMQVQASTKQEEYSW